MFELHRDYLATVRLEERRVEAQRAGEVRRLLQGRRRQPHMTNRLLAGLGGGLVRAGTYLQRRAQISATATLLVR